MSSKHTLEIIAVGWVMLYGSAVAQDSNPNSPAYHALHNAQSPNYVGPRAEPAPVQQPPQPTGYWEKTWGAIAPSPVGGVLGTALGASSKEEAEQLALADCKQKGGGACQVEIAYQNQCAAMAMGKSNYRFVSAASVSEASEESLKLCRERGDINCQVYYSACTEPVFHRY